MTAMTPDELLLKCKSTIGKPLNRMQAKIGLPREQSIGGPLMRKIVHAIAPYVDSNVWVSLNDPQMRTLEKELGRQLCNSGDTLFGCVLIGLDMHDEGIGSAYVEVR